MRPYRTDNLSKPFGIKGEECGELVGTRALSSVTNTRSCRNAGLSILHHVPHIALPHFISILSIIVLLNALAPVAVAQSTAEDHLWDAAIAGDTTAILIALSDGADINALDTRRSRNGRRALNWAAWYNHVESIAVLLAHGADLEAKNLTGFTPLHHAAESGSAEALQALLAAGADPNAANNIGRRPIETARERGRTRIVQLLEAAGGD